MYRFNPLQLCNPPSFQSHFWYVKTSKVEAQRLLVTLTGANLHGCGTVTFLLLRLLYQVTHQGAEITFDCPWTFLLLFYQQCLVIYSCHLRCKLKLGWFLSMLNLLSGAFWFFLDFYFYFLLFSQRHSLIILSL